MSVHECFGGGGVSGQVGASKKRKERKKGKKTLRERVKIYLTPLF